MYTVKEIQAGQLQDYLNSLPENVYVMTILDGSASRKDYVLVITKEKI